VSGVRCQDDVKASLKKTACSKPFDLELGTERLGRAGDARKEADGFLPSAIGLLTPDT
jgi:hypothetical protein